MSIWDRFLGRARTEQGLPDDLDAETAQKIIQDYGAVLASADPAPDRIADVRVLPHPKKHIKEAICLALRAIDDPKIKEHLKFAYISLADWQEGVGSEQVGIDIKKLNPNMDTLDMAKEIASRGRALKKWMPIVKAEQDALTKELQELGLW